MALPLAQVARLEEFPCSAVEKAALGEVVQYRGEILPLVRLGKASPRPDGTRGKDSVQVVVCSQREHSVGLVVERILDILDAPLDVQHTIPAEGILGSAVIKDRVTDLLDAPGFLRLAVPERPAAWGGGKHT
jgi:two-component system chemotaxis sensor kinase CheA